MPTHFKIWFKRATGELVANQLTTTLQCAIDRPLGDPLPCRDPNCHRIFFGPTARACHEYKSHKIKVCSRLYIAATNTCRKCMKWFPTRALIVKHMKKSQACLPTLIRCVVPLSTEEADELDRVDVEHRKAYTKDSKNVVVKKEKQNKTYGPLRQFDDEDTVIAQIPPEIVDNQDADEDTIGGDDHGEDSTETV